MVKGNPNRSSLAAPFIRAALFLLLAGLWGCPDGGESGRPGLAPATGDGPRIVFDPLAEPTPEVPLPNDLLTVADSLTPTGKRINISPFAPTAFEEEVREHMDELNGFGTYAPISLSFDRPIDLSTVGPDTIKVINITPGTRTFGQAVPLDLGAGNFPLSFKAPWQFPPHDRYEDAWNILLDPYYEDIGLDEGCALGPGEAIAENNLESGYHPSDEPDPCDDNYHPILNPRGTEGNGRFDTEDRNDNGRLDVGEDSNGNGLLDAEPDYDRDGVVDPGNRVDWNGNGVLDCGEDFNCNQRWDDDEVDLDGDGMLAPCEFTEFYEVETNTLMARPIVPMEQETEYAVVIAKGMTGLGPDGAMGGGDGEPVRSPFPYVNHAVQTDRLIQALPLIASNGVALDEIAFAWTFTTQSTTRVLEAIRDGLLGEGFLGFLPQSHPAVITSVVDQTFTRDGGLLFDPLGRDHVYILQGEFLDAILSIVLPFIPGYSFEDLDLSWVDHIVFGRYVSPNFRDTDDGVFEIDLAREQAAIGVEEIPFLIVVPKEQPLKGYVQPFPVLLYSHGNESFHFEGVMACANFAKRGIAVAAIDAVGHGPAITPKMVVDTLDEAGLSETLQVLLLRLVGTILEVDFTGVGWSRDAVIDALLTNGVLKELGVDGRAEDIDGDGYRDNGEIFFTADIFRTRDVVRQTAVDLMQLVRVLQNLDAESVPPRIPSPDRADEARLMENLLAGDFDCDGRPDVGGRVDAFGRTQRYFETGASLGGIMTSVVMGVEPDILTGTPVVPGGGFADVIVRSNLKTVMERVYYQVHGPLLIGEESPRAGGVFDLIFKDRIRKDLYLEEPVGSIRIPPCESLHVINLRNGEEKWAVIREKEGRRVFSVGIAANVGDPLVITSYDAAGAQADSIETTTVSFGFGIERNSPRFRQFMGLAQIMLEAGDPVNYAPHWFLDPLPGMPAKKILEMVAPGDFIVPVFTGLSLARAGGLLGTESNECDGEPRDLSSCDAILEATGNFDRYHECIQADCDLINYSLLRHRVMLSFEKANELRYDVDDRDANNCDGCEELPEGYCRECIPLGPLPTIAVEGGGLSGMRFPFTGSHSFFVAPSTTGYSGAEIYTYYAQSQAALFHSTGGEVIEDCLIEDLCSPDCRLFHD